MSRDLSLLSTTPASNDAAGGWQTGMAPSKVKNAGWADESIIAQLFNALPAGGGTANAQTLTNPVPITTLTTGLTVIYLPSNANTAATTFAPDGLTAKNIFAWGAACQGGELATTVPAWLKYDGTQWNLLNPLRNTNGDYAATSGTNTITATIPGLTAVYNGLRVKIKIANTTTGAATFNPNSTGALNLYYADGTTQLVAGAFIQNNIYDMIYDSSLNAAAGGWIVINPSRVTGSFTGTLATGLTTTPSGTVNYAIAPDGKTIQTWVTSNISGTSNATGMTMTGIPAALTTTSSKTVYLAVTDSGAGAQGDVRTGTSTTWTFGKGGTTTGFTNTGTKGIPATAYTSFTND